MTEQEPKKLTSKQKVFIDEYLKCFNAAEAARRAGYSASRARITGSELLADSNVSEQIRARLAEVHMSADEALKLTADIARGDVAQLMDVTSMGFSFDMNKAKELGLTRLIKKVKQKVITQIAKSESGEDREIVELEVELYDAQAAIRDILKLHGKFTDKIEVTANHHVEIGIKQIDYRTDLAKTEAGPSGDSEASGEDQSPVDGSKVG
jgi:phage terminase small subunit